MGPGQDAPWPRSRLALTLAVAVAISALGMALHTVREFGLPGLVSPDSGMIPVVAVQLVLLALWWSDPVGKHGLATALGATGVFQLVGGGILSVLPLPFLPFEPEQTAGHYLSHVILGIAQLPLIVGALAARRGGRR